METNFKEELDKLVQQAKDLADDIHLKENLERLRDGLVDLAGKTGQKIDELAHDEELKTKIKDGAQKVADTAVAGAKFVGDKTTEFFERPDVQEGIEKAKDKTIEVAEKGVDALKKALKKD
jgi:phage terminase small subunit